MKNYTKTEKSMTGLENTRIINKAVNNYYNCLSREEGNNVELDSNYKMEKKFYRVLAKCGHVGTNRYVLVNFAVNAYSGVEAAEKARMIPRVKHDHKDAIRELEEITEEEFMEIRRQNDNDPYLKAECIQDQRRHAMDNLKVYQEESVMLANTDKYWDKVYDRKDKLDYLKRKKQSIKKSYKNENWYE